MSKISKAFKKTGHELEKATKQTVKVVEKVAENKDVQDVAKEVAVGVIVAAV